ncbi:hypothetical protein B6254_0905 [Weissella cibaria]|uniref:Uncharacterized protein n=1 Tax=Weissella cibaria TaxID=137591 RepID=A0A2S1KQP0_9LACO|nr:hypothetical protein B6254_0905 [Weissella cibaria]
MASEYGLLASDNRGQCWPRFSVRGYDTLEAKEGDGDE